MTESADRVCLNCGVALTGRFCSQCGQRAVRAYPSVRELLGDAWHEFFGYDGRLLRTVTPLLTRPGALTVDAMEGRRARNVQPLRIYLAASMIYFLIAATAPNIGRPDAVVPGEEEIRIDLSDPRGAAALTPEQLAQARRNVQDAPWFLKPLFERVIEDPAAFRARVVSAMPRLLFGLVPVFAGLLAIFYRHRPYTQHLIFGLHLHAVIFLALAASELAKFTGSLAVVIGVVVVDWAFLVWYGLTALRRAYGGGWSRTVAKAAGLLVLYLVVWIVAMVALMIWAVWLG